MNFLNPAVAFLGFSDDFEGLPTEGEPVLTFPSTLSPLQGTVKITPIDSYIAREFDSGDEQREQKGLNAGTLIVSFELLLDEERGQKATYDEFFRIVGSHIRFVMNVPGVGARVWFKNKPNALSHLGGFHWKAQVELLSRVAG